MMRSLAGCLPDMSPHDAAELARRLMAAHGLTDWSFGFNRRKRGLGLCIYDSRRIELSIHFVVRNAEPDVRDTILHEIAHALAGPEAGHGQAWKDICLQIGAIPARCGEAAMPPGRWRATCPGCQRDHHRHRRPLPKRTYFCRDCGPQRGELTFALPRLHPPARTSA